MRFDSTQLLHLFFVSPVGQKACREVEESERLVETLQADVSALRIRLSEKKQSAAEKGLLSISCGGE